MKYLELNDGNKIPVIGFGTYKIVEEKDMYIAIGAALDAGYTTLILQNIIIMKKS